MYRKTLRTLAVVALVALTTTSAAHASGRSFSGLEISDFSKVWERIAGWLGSLTGQPEVRHEAVTKAGSSMDPNGGQPNTNAGTSSDAGSSMDPNGGR